MSARVLDQKGRWRRKVIAFRMSEAEASELGRLVAISGLTKQEYIIRKLLNKDVVVKGNPRVFKALKKEFEDILTELRRLRASEESKNEELMETIKIISYIYARLMQTEP